MDEAETPQGPNKNPVGRPNRYREIFYFANPAYKNADDKWIANKDAWEHLALLINTGLTNEQLAAVYRVDSSTIYDWEKKYPEFSDTLDIHKFRYDDGRVKRSLYERSTGWKGKETKAFVINGKIQTVEVEKHFPPDVTAIQTWLYNRQPEEWRSINHIDYTNKTAAPEDIYDYSKLNSEELEYLNYLLKKMQR